MKKNIELINFAITIILGIIIPFFFHLIGTSGKIFLPMFYPIVIGAFILKIHYAVAAGVITPILSSFLTGMPPLNPPIAFKMSIELFFIAFIISILANKTNFNRYFIVGAGIIGYIISIVPLQYLIDYKIFGLPFKSSLIFSITTSIPGLLIILVVLPNIAVSVKKNLNKRLSLYNE